MTDQTLTLRQEFAVSTARAGGAFALERFRDLDSLTIESKGHQDLVSDADRMTEDLVRRAISERYPDDGIVGEEYARVVGSSGYDWVIDPIDGTANFVRGIPHWCCVIACTHNGLPVVGAIFDPSTGEMFRAARGAGAFVNDRPMRVSAAQSLSEGSVAVGASGRSDREEAAALVREVLLPGGMFFRSASGALMLAYVAAGRLLGYVEDHMNSWDCFAALLMLGEAGGQHLPLDPELAITEGTRVIAGGPQVYPLLGEIADRVYAKA
ncbi:MAG: inositol monophosphatase family protein [Pseudomonadota bacterium]